MTASNRKIHGEFRESTRTAEIIPLYSKKLSNEEIRQRQYAAQVRMLEEAKAANPEIAITPEMLAVRHQPVREISETMAQQAAMQGEKGFAFKMY